jgi:glycerate-2-kinase
MSDVIGDNLDVIASGPFYPDASSFDDAWKIINKYNIRQGLPNSICSYIHKGMAGKVPETPKADDPAFKNIHHKIVSSNTIALNAAKTKAESLGFEVKIVDTPLMGEAKDAAVLFTSKLIEHANKKPFCLLAGGETTVTLNNNPGMGGRNQEFALAAARDIQDTGNTIVASCATDGNDGPTDATGGIVDSQTMSKANKQNLDINQALAAHNAYPLLNSLGQLFITGPTNTNVMDIQIGLILP